MELHSFHQAVLTGLGHGQCAALQHVIKSHGRGSSADNRHTLNALRLVFFIVLLRYRVNARSKTVDLDFSCGIGFDGLVDAVTFYLECDTLHIAILRGLFQTNASGRCFHIQISRYIICVFHTSNQVLQVRITISNQFGTLAYNGNVISRGCDLHSAGKRICRRNGQRIPGLGNIHAAVRAGEAILRQNAVGVRQCQNILAILIFQFSG